jgi:2-phosphoglycerate kinase
LSAPPVVLVGGASGVGKSSVAYAIADRLRIPIVEIDDLVVAIQAVTRPHEHPDIHYWETHRDEAASWDVERFVHTLIGMAEALAPAVTAVIANHLETELPVVIEGDYLLPSLVATEAARHRVRGVFVHEPDAEQIVANYRTREPDAGDQHMRARVSVRYGDWLSTHAAAVGVPVVIARPWTTVVERAMAALTD